MSTVASQPAVSLVGNATVVTADPGGGFEQGSFHGIYVRDVRVLSRYGLTVDGAQPTLLRAASLDAGTLDAVFAAACNDLGDAQLVLLRHREVHGVVTDRLTAHGLTAHGLTAHGLTAGGGHEVAVALGGDLASLVAVKAGTVEQPVLLPEPVGAGRLAIVDPSSGRRVLTITIEGPQPHIDAGVLRWYLDVDAGASWTCTLRFIPAEGSTTGAAVGPASVLRETATRPEPVTLQVTGSDHRWQRLVDTAVGDLAALRVEHGENRYIAAGVPWYLALFGRDALLTGIMSLPLGTDLLLDTLDTLAHHQGRRHDPRTLEQPGRILHELRTGEVGVFGLAPGQAYYGSVDATPLFVLALTEAARFGADPARIARLLPAARAAVAWCREHGDVDGDGFVEAVADPHGIANQGWKDSRDAMVHADGSPAPPPIALVEVQGYVHAALRGLAELEERVGDPGAAPGLRANADALAERIEEAFFSPRLGGLVLGLDAAKRPLEVATSNMGHALWTATLSMQQADAVARRVTAPDLLTSWGIRTLADSEVAYAPLVYHRGTIWPHDTAIVAHGLARAGAHGAALRVTGALLDLAEHVDFRLPELVGGIDRDSLAAPVPYPVACTPQAWSSAAPLLALRAVLGLEPDVPAGVLHLSPTLPDGAWLSVRGLRLGHRVLRIDCRPDGVEVQGADDLDVEVEPADGADAGGP